MCKYCCKKKCDCKEERKKKKREPKCIECGQKKCCCKINHKININVEDMESNHKHIVCQNICGNIFLHEDTPSLEIWQKRTSKDVTATISVFNHKISMNSILVLVNQIDGGPFDFTVPPGNTVSVLVEDVESIILFRTDNGKNEGKFCIDLCFPTSCSLC